MCRLMTAPSMSRLMTALIVSVTSSSSAQDGRLSTTDPEMTPPLDEQEVKGGSALHAAGEQAADDVSLCEDEEDHHRQERENAEGHEGGPVGGELADGLVHLQHQSALLRR